MVIIQLAQFTHRDQLAGAHFSVCHPEAIKRIFCWQGHDSDPVESVAAVLVVILVEEGEVGSLEEVGHVLGKALGSWQGIGIGEGLQDDHFAGAIGVLRPDLHLVLGAGREVANYQRGRGDQQPVEYGGSARHAFRHLHVAHPVAVHRRAGGGRRGVPAYFQRGGSERDGGYVERRRRHLRHVAEVNQDGVGDVDGGVGIAHRVLAVAHVEGKPVNAFGLEVQRRALGHEQRSGRG